MDNLPVRSLFFWIEIWEKLGLVSVWFGFREVEKAMGFIVSQNRSKYWIRSRSSLPRSTDSWTKELWLWGTWKKSGNRHFPGWSDSATWSKCLGSLTCSTQPPSSQPNMPRLWTQWRVSLIPAPKQLRESIRGSWRLSHRTTCPKSIKCCLMGNSLCSVSFHFFSISSWLNVLLCWLWTSLWFILPILSFFGVAMLQDSCERVSFVFWIVWSECISIFLCFFFKIRVHWRDKCPVSPQPNRLPALLGH